VQVIPVQSRITEDLLDMELPHVDLVLDCSDNFTTRFSVNRACVKHAKPLVSGAAIRMEGQVSVFNGHHPKKPCYQCLYQPEGENQENCTSNGVLGPVVGVIGSIMACEAIKMLTGIGETLEGRLLLFDAQLMRFNEVRLGKDPQCPVCG
jgi:molybdopterin/thiamine biosynthesis adenylyltransferase